MFQLPQFIWVLRSSIWDVFNNFLLSDATDRTKISSDQKRFFIALSLYPLSFFANHPWIIQTLDHSNPESSNTWIIQTLNHPNPLDHSNPESSNTWIIQTLNYSIPGSSCRIISSKSWIIQNLDHPAGSNPYNPAARKNVQSLSDGKNLYIVIQG